MAIKQSAYNGSLTANVPVQPNVDRVSFETSSYAIGGHAAAIYFSATRDEGETLAIIDKLIESFVRDYF